LAAAPMTPMIITAEWKYNSVPDDEDDGVTVIASVIVASSVVVVASETCDDTSALSSAIFLRKMRDPTELKQTAHRQPQLISWNS